MLFAMLLLCGIQLAQASNAPQVSGTYSLVQKKALGSQEQVQMRIHLVNRGTAALSIERITIWDFSYPEKGGTAACTIALGAHASADTTQEFTIRRVDFQTWGKGARPRLILQLTGPGNRKSKTVVRLDRESTKEVR